MELHKPKWHFSMRSILSVPALGAFLVSVCMFACHVVRSAPWRAGIWTSDFFSKRLGLIAWLSESMSQSNPSCRSASSPKAEESTLLFFSSCSMPRKGLFRSSRHLKPISLAKDVHQVLKPKKIGIWDTTDIAKRRIKHHPFRHCISRFFRSDDDLQCTLYSTLYRGRLQRKFCESRRKVGTIPYRTVRMISRAGAQPTGSWNCDWDRSAVLWGYRELWLQEVVLLQKTIELHKPEWHFSIWSILSVPALGAYLVVFLSVCHVVRSALWRWGYERLIFF